MCVFPAVCFSPTSQALVCCTCGERAKSGTKVCSKACKCYRVSQ